MIMFFSLPSMSFAEPTEYPITCNIEALQPNWGKIVKFIVNLFKKAPKPKPSPIRPTPKPRPTPIHSVPIITPIAENASKLIDELSANGGNYFKLGSKKYYTEEELLKGISSHLQIKTASFSRYNTHATVEIEGLDLERGKVMIGKLYAYMHTTAPKMAEYNFSAAEITSTFKNGKQCVVITIPRKSTAVINNAELSRITGGNLKFYIASQNRNGIKRAFNKLFKEGGYLTQERLEKALREENIPSSAIISECQVFNFAKKTENDDTIQQI